MDFPNMFFKIIELEFMPEEIKGVKFCEPRQNPGELKITEEMGILSKDKY